MNTIQNYFEQLSKTKSFSGSVLVAKNGSVLFSQGFGMCNYELNVPNTPKTKFRIASITKQFTAVAILQLVEQGLLTLETPMSKFLTKFPQAENITIHHLLTHTSGLPLIQESPNFLSLMRQPTTNTRFCRLYDRP